MIANKVSFFKCSGLVLGLAATVFLNGFVSEDTGAGEPPRKRVRAAGAAVAVAADLQQALMPTLFDDFKRYITTNTQFHAGNLDQHSLWVARAVAQWFNENCPWVEGIDKEYERLIIIAALLHDIGKAGDKRTPYYAKPSHPQDGCSYLLGKKPYTLITDGVFDFAQLLQQLRFSKQEVQIVAFLVRAHWLFGKYLSEGKRAAFYKELRECAVDVGCELDEQLIRMAILVGAADIRGLHCVQFNSGIIDLLFGRAMNGECIAESYPAEQSANWYDEEYGYALKKALVDYWKTLQADAPSDGSWCVVS